MSRIASYPIQSIIVGSDKVIGTDVLNNGATKNFTFDEIAKRIVPINAINTFFIILDCFSSFINSIIAYLLFF